MIGMDQAGGTYEVHPILVELLARPVGWLTIGGALIMAGLAIGIPLFILRQAKREQQENAPDDR